MFHHTRDNDLQSSSQPVLDLETMRPQNTFNLACLVPRRLALDLEPWIRTVLFLVPGIDLSSRLSRVVEVWTEIG